MEYVNGAPTHYASGVEDGSTQKLYPTEKKTCQCHPLMFLNTKKGQYKETTVIGAEFNATYGLDSLNPLKKFFNHQSLFALEAIGLAAQVTVMRAMYVPIDPDDNPTNGRANITIFVTRTSSDLADSYPIKRDENGFGVWEDGEWTVDDSDDDAKVPVQYYQLSARFMSDEDIDALQVRTFEDAITKGDETVDGEVTPIMTIKSIAHGDYYNGIGLKLYPLTGDSADKDMMDKARNMAYFIGLVDMESGEETIIKTIQSTDGYTVTFDPNASHPVTGVTTTLEDLFPKGFENTTRPEYEYKAPIIGEVIYHRIGIRPLFENILTKEAENFDGTVIPWSDFTEFESEAAKEEALAVPYILNFINCIYTSGAPMENTRRSDNLVLNDESLAYAGNRINMTKDTTLFLEGGLDGMNIVDNYDDYLVEHEADLIRRLTAYADKDSEQTHLALSTVSEFVDTGYTLDTTLKMGIFTSYRTDVRLIASTYDVNPLNKDISVQEHISRGVLLNAILSLSIESADFNTPGFRTAILAGSGLSTTGFFRYRVSTALDFALKNVKMFRGDTWDTTYEFSYDEGNIVEYLTDVTPRRMPESQKTNAWDAGIIWTDAADTLKVRYPQIGTIYPDDTSILKNWYIAVAVCYIEKKLDEAHREVQGAAVFTQAQQIKKTQEKIVDKISGKFANIVNPTVEVFKTPRDMSAGYAVTARVKIWGPSMLTVLNSSILALRA
jgi:hypothetical protein